MSSNIGNGSSPASAATPAAATPSTTNIPLTGVFQRSHNAAQRLLGQLVTNSRACAPLNSCLTSATQTGAEESLEEAKGEIQELRRERVRWEMESKASSSFRAKMEAELATQRDRIAAKEAQNSRLHADILKLNADLVRYL